MKANEVLNNALTLTTDQVESFIKTAPRERLVLTPDLIGLKWTLTHVTSKVITDDYTQVTARTVSDRGVVRSVHCSFFSKALVISKAISAKQLPKKFMDTAGVFLKNDFGDIAIENCKPFNEYFGIVEDQPSQMPDGLKIKYALISQINGTDAPMLSFQHYEGFNDVSKHYWANKLGKLSWDKFVMELSKTGKDRIPTLTTALTEPKVKGSLVQSIGNYSFRVVFEDARS